MVHFPNNLHCGQLISSIYRSYRYLNPDDLNLQFGIPKEHTQVHVPGHSKFSFNFLRWVGLTYSEGVESHWALMNPITLSARKMSLSLRQELMNDRWGCWNWRKIVDLGPALLHYSATFDAQDVQTWEALIAAWDEDPELHPDPYEEPQNVKHEIALEDAKDINQGRTLTTHEVMPGIFLQVGLEIEEQHCIHMCGLCVWKLDSSSLKDLTEQQAKRNALLRRIGGWQAIQDVYMPLVSILHAVGTDGAAAPGEPIPGTPSPSIHPKSVPLFLPSSLLSYRKRLTNLVGTPVTMVEVTTTYSYVPMTPYPPPPPPSLAEDVDESTDDTVDSDMETHLQSVVDKAIDNRYIQVEVILSLANLLNKEKWLRVTQLSDTLQDIRHLRRILTAISDYTRCNVNREGASEHYHTTHAAMINLNPSGDWSTTYKVLSDANLRGPRKEDMTSSEGRYEVSWIWLSPTSTMCTANFATPATAKDFAAKEELLLEEMRCVLEYCRWKATWWRSQADRHGTLVPLPILRGLRVYADKQAGVWEGVAHRSASYWINYVKKCGPLPDWLKPYKRHARKVHFRNFSKHISVRVFKGSDGEQSSESSDMEDEDENEEEV
ncbi:hypothetical protein VTO73DRAFT_6437 [Trametes versicolor]